MKYILILLLLTASSLRAQIPHIDYMIADEAKSQLQIHGTFASDTTGFVTIENTKQTIRFWSDTLLICDLPDSGAGSGGNVTVQQMSGTSNVRMLSIFEAEIYHNLTLTWCNSAGCTYTKIGVCDWLINWRADILDRPSNLSQGFAFQISKTSYAHITNDWSPPYTDAILPWSDSSSTQDSSIFLKGYIDLKAHQVIFVYTKVRLKSINSSSNETPIDFSPNTISFDTTGYLQGYHYFSINYLKEDDYLENQKILFPPSIKNAVAQSTQPSSPPIKIFSHFSSDDHQISLIAEEPFGQTTASLYSIDGRLLKQEKIFISSAGMYSFDASGINVNFGFLVIKTPKGIVTGKVMF